VRDWEERSALIFAQQLRAKRKGQVAKSGLWTKLTFESEVSGVIRTEALMRMGI
jgi:hypothetical protein